MITPPISLKSIAFAVAQGFSTDSLDPDSRNMIDLNQQMGRQINLHCNTVSLPGHDLQTQDQQHGSAPGRQIVSSHDYSGTIAASFYLDSHLRERHFFEQWQKMAVNHGTHKVRYYDEYIGTMQIFQLDGDGEITYGIEATEVYPSTIGGIEYAYANANTIATQAVQFNYRQWYNLTADSIAEYGRQKRIEREEVRPPEVYRQDKSRRSAIAEAKRQEQLRKPILIDREPPPPLTSIREKKRQEQLLPPLQQATPSRVNSTNSTNTNKEAIARGLGYESAAALKTALRNRARGL